MLDIEVACYGYEGVDAVKEALKCGLNMSTEDMPIKVCWLLTYYPILSTIYTVVHKKRATLFLTITPMFHGGFLHLLYQWKQE